MIEYPRFPKCWCEFHLPNSDDSVPTDALLNPFAYLPPSIEFTPEMAVLADRYASHNFGSDYAALQAAYFLKPKTSQQHSDRKQQFAVLKQSAESQGFSVPDVLTELFTTDSYIDRLHHNCVWPTLPEQIVRLPSNTDFVVFLILREGQACGIWHLLLAPDGTHTIINADNSFGCPSEYPTNRQPDSSAFEVWQCMDSVHHLLYYYFTASARHDISYLETLDKYFSDHSL